MRLVLNTSSSSSSTYPCMRTSTCLLVARTTTHQMVCVLCMCMCMCMGMCVPAHREHHAVLTT